VRTFNWSSIVVNRVFKSSPSLRNDRLSSVIEVRPVRHRIRVDLILVRIGKHFSLYSSWIIEFPEPNLLMNVRISKTG